MVLIIGRLFLFISIVHVGIINKNFSFRPRKSEISLTIYFDIILPQEREEARKKERERGSIAVRTPRFYSGPFGVTTSVETSFSVGLQIPGPNMRTIMGSPIINLL